MNRFRVATYNIHKCRGMDWKVRPERILAVLEEIDADLVALQETFGPQVEFLAEATSLFPAFGPTGRLQAAEYGNAVLSRFPISRVQNYDLTVSGREPRRCLRTDLDIPEWQALSFFSVHLGTSYFERRRQAEKLLSGAVFEQSQAGQVRLIAGDFNEWTRGLTTRLLSRHFKSGDARVHLGGRGKTYPGLAPVWHLDHIYYDHALHLANMRLHKTPRSLMASDHLPLVAEFEVG